MKPANIRQFFAKFSSDDECLAHLFDVRYGQGHVCPKCEREAKWYPLTSEKAFSCQWCGHHIHPMAGTIFEKSRTPLQMWFYAIFLFTTSKHGVSGKELQRQLGVTYKTAWRMGQMIRKHMAEVDGEDPLGGPGKVVEVNETFVGGKSKGKGQGYRGDKTVLMGMVERNGDIMFKVVPNQRANSLIPHIKANVAHGSEVHTDELSAYRKFADPALYTHKTVNHRDGEYATVDGTSTNLVESAFGHFKRSIRGTHTNVSRKYLERYAKEFEYRFNRRDRQASMLPELLSSFAKRGV